MNSIVSNVDECNSMYSSISLEGNAITERIEDSTHSSIFDDIPYLTIYTQDDCPFHQSKIKQVIIQ